MKPSRNDLSVDIKVMEQDQRLQYPIRISVMIDDEVLTKLKLLSKNFDLNRSEVIRRLILNVKENNE